MIDSFSCSKVAGVSQTDESESCGSRVRDLCICERNPLTTF